MENVQKFFETLPIYDYGELLKKLREPVNNMIYFKARKEKAMKRRFLLLSILIISMLFVTGCGKEEEKEESISTSSQVTNVSEEQEESREKTLDELYADALAETTPEIRSAISGSTVVDVDGKLTAIIEINNGGMMADVAEFTTKTIDQIAPEYTSYDIMIEYDLGKDNVVSWHSYDNKVGILINTLTNYCEENVTVDGLYSWKEGK